MRHACSYTHITCDRGRLVTGLAGGIGSWQVWLLHRGPMEFRGRVACVGLLLGAQLLDLIGRCATSLYSKLVHTPQGLSGTSSAWLPLRLACRGNKMYTPKALPKCCLLSHYIPYAFCSTMGSHALYCLVVSRLGGSHAQLWCLLEVLRSALGFCCSVLLAFITPYVRLSGCACCCVCRGAMRHSCCVRRAF